MEIQIGDAVTRTSHNNDVIFKVIKIEGNIAYLKGMDVRLYADSPLEDLVKTEHREEKMPEVNILTGDRDEYFYLPGKILHIDGDQDYLDKSLAFYKSAGVLAVGKRIPESEVPQKIDSLLKEIKPDILVITGHDAFYGKLANSSDISKYKNSKYFMKSVLKARDYEKSHEKLVIIAGACQSDYEDITKSGANFASSPKRVNIHALDPAIIAVNIALTDKNKRLDIKELLNKTKYGKNGIGGLVGNGMMYVGYPR